MLLSLLSRLNEFGLRVSVRAGWFQLLKSTELGRHSLLYLKEIGDGWFGKVLLGEVNAGLSTTQVVVKELKASASVQDQMHFLEEAQPYRALQHPALLQCLAQCTEVTPYLLVMEFCPLGDVKGYMRSCRTADTMTPEPLILQRMACEIASGLLHLHKHNFVHSDLALRNCLLTADVTVKIGDYGLSHNKYKDDYFVTSDQMYVPLRWIAPELIDEVHGNLLVVGQSKQSNVWSLGVTIWELFELGNQPYRHYSDRQVLTYAVREQQLRLPKPLLNIPLAERWYEVMQFCWLQPDQRPNAEEVHLLLSYLCAKGANEAEEDFERRWNSLRPNPNAGPNNSLHHGAGALAIDLPSSSFPLLEQFSGCDGYHSESGDDILTVTETSHGLNFEYKWEKARAGAEQPYHRGMVGGCGGVAYYEPKMLHGSGVGVVPVLSACSPSVSAEYYVRMEEPGVDCHINMDLDYTMCSYSPDYQGSNRSFLTGNGSPAISLTMEPLLGQVSDSSPLRPWEAGHYVSYKDRDGGFYYEHSPPMGIGHHMGLGDPYLETTKGPGSIIAGISITMASEDSDEEEDIFSERQRINSSNTWPSNLSNHCPNNNSLGLGRSRQAGCRQQQDAYVDFLYTMPTTDIEDSWPEEHNLTFRSSPPPIEDQIYVDITMDDTLSIDHKQEVVTEDKGLSHTLDSGLDRDHCSSISLVDISDCYTDDDDEDDDITDVTSGIFADEASAGDLNASPSLAHPLKSLQKQVGTPDSMTSMDSMDLMPLAAGSTTEPFSPAFSSSHPSSSSPKAMDSGYDTENNESPEFVPKEPHNEPRDPKTFTQPLGESDEDEPALDEDELAPLSEKNPYRDSAYFSDYENERLSRDDEDEKEEEEGDETSALLEESEDPEMEGCLTEECHHDEGLELGLELASNISGEVEEGSEGWPAQEEPSSLGDWAAEVVGAMEEALGELKRSSKSIDKDDDDEENGPPARRQRFSSSSPPSIPPSPLPPMTPPPVRADEEDGDGDSDDSESDEELRCYSVQEEQSGGEESEEENHVVPIVVSDCSDAHNLRSLLKVPTTLTSESLADDLLGRKKKVVSFFDDVTVYLFDQQSPTKELAEHGFSPEAETSGQGSESKQPTSDDSSDGNISEESAGYEWEDDFPLLPLPTSSSKMAASSSASTPSTPSLPATSKAPEPKPAVQYSRFTVSPSHVSRFSITHVSDSDIDSGPGSSEDGDRE
ncbi:unnamed protein product [Oncorhynchus mykiss]|uniref:non-specific serine/threonine protein kinase n=1 Tax=Oncorhynchus mykiss TaxID=8022 RepID=A0A060WRZ3_ONCMY|nr:unnamed protein product [Oncorhynchus mykiss]